MAPSRTSMSASARKTAMLLLATGLALLLESTLVDGHAFQINPPSRHTLRTRAYNDGSVYPVEKHADAYNGGGPPVVKERQIERTDPDVLRKYGGGEIWPWAAAWDLGEICPNGNYLENDDIAVSHGVCGDTPQSGDDNEIIYSTPNAQWDVIETYEAGAIIDIDIIVTNYHWGHMEFFVCCSADLENPDGVVTQSCFNKYPLDRAPDDSFNSPVDPAYPGRYILDPPCRKDETDQTRPELEGVLNDGSVMHMRYQLPDITCEHAVLQMRYHSGTGCKSDGYDEFNPDSWPSECAPDKEDWIALGSAECRKPGAAYGNIFWNCADISITGGSGGTPTTPEPTPSPATAVSPTSAPVPVASPTSPPVAEAMPTPSPVEELTPTASPMEETTPTPAPVYEAPPTPDTLMPQALPPMGDATPAPTIGAGTEPDEGEGGTYEHLGCFQDKSADRVLGHVMKDSSMTPDLCMQHCSMAGAAYMATQYGHECWCSRHGNLKYGRHGDGICDIYCDGDSTVTCGGSNAFDLYKLVWASAPTDEEYMDCYSDSREDRVMENRITDPQMTASVCRAHCLTDDAMYYATQYGNECWCGTSEKFTDYERHGEGVCHMGCSGDSGVACGGNNAFSLFRYL